MDFGCLRLLGGGSGWRLSAEPPAIQRVAPWFRTPTKHHPLPQAVLLETEKHPPATAGGSARAAMVPIWDSVFPYKFPARQSRLAEKFAVSCCNHCAYHRFSRNSLQHSLQKLEKCGFWAEIADLGEKTKKYAAKFPAAGNSRQRSFAQRRRLFLTAGWTAGGRSAVHLKI